VVVELAISGVEEKLTIRKRPLLRVKGLEKKVSLRGVRCLRGIPHLSNGDYLSSWKGTSGYIFVSACLGYFYTRVYFLVIAFVLEVIYILFITCDISLVLILFSLSCWCT